MIRIVKSPQAIADLESVWLFSADNFGVQAADTLLEKFEASFAQLAEYPLTGIDRSAIRRGLRAYFRPTPFVILYRAFHDRIEIVRIFHGKQDYEVILHH